MTIRTTLVACLATALLSLAATGAWARSGLAVEAQEFTAIADNLVFSESSGEGMRVTCEVTLTGSLHGGTIPKTVGALVGFVTQGASNSCRNNINSSSTLDFLVPWHITYLGFTGSLPEDVRTVELLLDRVEFLTTIGTIFFGDIDCLYSENVPTTSNDGVGGTSGPGIRSFSLDEDQLIPIFRELAAGISDCPEAFKFNEDPFVLHDPITIELAD